MKDIFAAFGSEVFRPMMTILLPGLVAISTLLVGLLQRFDTLQHLAESKRLETGLAVFLIALACGEILEDVGSHIETRFDNQLKRKSEHFDTEWYDYLSSSFQNDIVGKGYLDSLVIRLKFEFGLALGLLGCAAGLWATFLPTYWSVGLTVLCAGVAGYLFWEAHETHGTLAKLRHEMLIRIKRNETAAGVGAGS